MVRTRLIKLTVFLLPMLLLVACVSEERVPIPKPKGWPRMELPAHSYQSFENETCPFTFEFPKMAEIEKSKDDSCWVDIYFPHYECRWHLTYRHIPSSGKTFADHYEEYRTLVYKHIQKVTQIKERPVEAKSGNGVMYELFGTVGVPAQMLFADSVNMVMTSFYFDAPVANDSLAPLIDYMKEDLMHLAQTLEWK